MTLLKLKKNIKLISFLVFLVFYAFGFFMLGKITNIKIENPIKLTGKQAIKLNLPIQSPSLESKSQQGNVISSYIKLCSNTAYSFEVSYPKNWFTTYNEEDQKCRFFAPYSFIVPQDTNMQFVPISVEVSNPSSWAQTVKFYENPNDFQNIISAEDVSVGTRETKKIIAKTTGEGALPKNFQKISYLIFSSELPLVITYQQTEIDENVQEMETALTEIAASVSFF